MDTLQVGQTVPKVHKTEGIKKTKTPALSKCPLCHNHGVHPLHEKITPQFDLLECGLCDGVFLDLQGASTATFYDDTYYPQEPLLFERMDAWARFRQLSRILPPQSRVLEIGCGHGLTLQKLKQAGHHVSGTEFSSHAASYAKDRLKIPMHVGSVDQLPVTDETFDLITLYHVLEHLEHPQTVLTRLHSMLKPTGHLLLEVPNYRSAFSRWFKSCWFHLDVPRHVFHYGKRSLIQILARSGYSIETCKTRYFLYDVFGNCQSFLNKHLQTQQVLNGKEVQVSLTLDTLLRSPREFLETLAARALFPILFVAFSAIQAVFTALRLEGGTLTIVAKPIQRSSSRYPSPIRV